VGHVALLQGQPLLLLLLLLLLHVRLCAARPVLLRSERLPARWWHGRCVCMLCCCGDVGADARWVWVSSCLVCILPPQVGAASWRCVALCVLLCGVVCCRDLSSR
jgi:hypothetical protein